MQEMRDTTAVSYTENKAHNRSPLLSVITSYVNRLNSPIERQRLADG